MCGTISRTAIIRRKNQCGENKIKWFNITSKRIKEEQTENTQKHKNVQMCVNANSDDDNTSTQTIHSTRILYSFRFYSYFVCVCVRCFGLTIANNEVTERVPLQKCGFVYIYCSLAFVARNKCYYCLPNTQNPANR